MDMHQFYWVPLALVFAVGIGIITFNAGRLREKSRYSKTESQDREIGLRLAEAVGKHFRFPVGVMGDRYDPRRVALSLLAGQLPTDSNADRDLQALRNHMAATRKPDIPRDLSPETADALVKFCTALAQKLRDAEVKYGYSNNWMRGDWEDDCRKHLLQHIDKGDPRDVANYCMFLWYHGWSAATPETNRPSASMDNA